MLLLGSGKDKSSNTKIINTWQKKPFVGDKM